MQFGLNFRNVGKETVKLTAFKLNYVKIYFGKNSENKMPKIIFSVINLTGKIIKKMSGNEREYIFNKRQISTKFI